MSANENSPGDISYAPRRSLAQHFEKSKPRIKYKKLNQAHRLLKMFTNIVGISWSSS